MTSDANLTAFTLRLTIRGPVFIGANRKIGKKEYSYNPRTRDITFFDPQKLLECIVKNGLMDSYEAYMLSDARSLYDFFYSNFKNGAPPQFSSAVSYKTTSGDAIFGAGGQPADICAFVRDAQGRPYIPGSSVKGMLRTAITAACLISRTPDTPKPQPMGVQDRLNYFKRSENQKMRALDTELFHTLGFNAKRPDNAVNSIFRGLSVADSKPLSGQALVLCRKLDIHPQGGTKELPLVRECLRPGLTVDIPVTLDKTLAGFITPEFIGQAVAGFDEWYTKTVFPHYSGCRIALPQLTRHLFLGGGSGYQSKTVTGQWLGEDDALDYISAFMSAQFRGKNSRDRELGISPHMLKCTAVNGQRLLFGLCEVNIL